MFTGIVDHVGNIQSIEKTQTGLAMWIETRFELLELGESICTDGVCLTVADSLERAFRVDISPETLERSRFASLQKGDALNLERSLRVGDRMGGHYVTGHVDQTMTLRSRERAGEYWGFEFSGALAENHPLLTPKGSVTVNGVSLTVNALTESGFKVMLIPHTMERTNLKRLEPGDPANVEFDWMSKVISQQLLRIMEQQK